MIPNIYFMFAQVKNDGTGNSDGDFVFGSTLFSKNTPLSSKLEMNEYDLALYYGIPFIKTATLGRLNIDAGLNIKLVDIDVSVSQGGVSETKQYAIPLPMLYLAAQLSIIKSLALEAEARLTALSSADYFYDFIGRVKYHVIGPAFLAAGYRYEDVQLDRKGLRVGSWTGGPFLEVGFSF
jgi:outer membrane protein